jgi:hypothetical protein
MMTYVSLGQVYKGENDLYIYLKGYQKDYTLLGRNALCSYQVAEGVLDIRIPLEKFKSLDSLDRQQYLIDEFEEDLYPDLNIKTIIPAGVIDKSSDKIQRFLVTADVMMGDITLHIPITIEIAFIDKNMFLDFTFQVTHKGLDVKIPEKHDKLLTGVIQFSMLNGKLQTSAYK